MRPACSGARREPGYDTVQSAESISFAGIGASSPTDRAVSISGSVTSRRQRSETPHLTIGRGISGPIVCRGFIRLYQSQYMQAAKLTTSRCGNVTGSPER